jgi:hypothetical protein
MAIKTIPLSQLERDTGKALSECADSGATVVVELPDQRLVAIQPLDPVDDDDLINELLETNPSFQALVARSKAGPRKPFPLDPEPDLASRDRRSNVPLVDERRVC